MKGIIHNGKLQHDDPLMIEIYVVLHRMDCQFTSIEMFEPLEKPVGNEVYDYYMPCRVGFSGTCEVSTIADKRIDSPRIDGEYLLFEYHYATVGALFGGDK